ncbi:MAG: hypothetical protein AAFP22_14320, partial [Planctomycetota bacterium]
PVVTSTIHRLQALKPDIGIDSDEFDLESWSKAIELEAEWSPSSSAFPPDLEFYFGDDLLAQAREAADLAGDAISRTGDYFAERDEDAPTRFSKCASELIGAMRSRLREELNADEKRER